MRASSKKSSEGGNDYLVRLEGAWIVNDAKSPEDAIKIALHEAKKKIKPHLEFVEIYVEDVPCPYCGERLEGVFLVAGRALVRLLFEMKVFDAESEEHASRIAKSVVGRFLSGVPLKVVEVVRL
ncbi:MAG: uncharacterized protein PWR13_453 [Archaeoglobi archaeon]|nr:DUF555 domain-containing protein [Candidatus Mnemosynella bozhongmuii]MDI3502951.1 uncharacterized protein [Archaeoglobi archaeon]MDK2781425.1 uncharacterized protein [Archaeoglobi archaeon]